MDDAKLQQGGRSGTGRILASLDALEGVDAALLSALEAEATLLSLETGARLFDAGDPTQSLHVVVSGALSLRARPGSARVPARLLAGDILYHASLRHALPRSIAAVAAEPSQVLSVPARAVEALLEGRPEVRAAVSAEAARHLLAMHLAATDMFGDASPPLFRDVVESSEFVSLKRSEILIREGDEPDCIYVVAWGSLEVYRLNEDGTRRSVDVLREGACIGELGLLLNERRTASVCARRDSLLVRVSGDCVERVLRSEAEVTFRLARTLGERLKRATASVTRAARVQTISLVAWCDDAGFARFCQDLRAALEASGRKVAQLQAPEPSHERFHAALAEQETAHDVVLCRCDRRSPDWTRRANEQADLVLFVCMPEAERPGEDETQQAELCKASGARAELVLLHRSAAEPRGAARWLELAAFAAHHHVVLGDERHYARLTRRVCGEAWGLVLGGGGARGLAHIGVIRALCEAGVPIDWIGGTSMGAIVAAQYAMGLGPDEILRLSRAAYSARFGSADYTFPFVSLRSGRSTIRVLREIFGERRIEDLPINYFCVSCNLTRAAVMIHERGPLWMWARVSCSVPGLLPPFPHQGDLLVDGGLLENLPVKAMRERCGERVVASDVSVAADLTVSRQLIEQPWWSGISQLWRKLSRQPALPDIFRVLMRTAEVGSVRDSRTSGDPATLYLHPPLDGVGMTDFHAIDRIVGIGYEHARARLREWSPRGAVGAREEAR